MAAIVEVRNLHKSFTRGAETIEVLMDLTLNVAEGEFLALMGPSGSGKTTLLNLLAGLDTPTSGTITVGDQLISAMGESELARWRTRHVGFVFQFYNLLPVLTAYENVELPLLLVARCNARSNGKKQVLKTRSNSSNLGDRHHAPAGATLRRAVPARRHRSRHRHRSDHRIVADEPTGALDSARSCRRCAIEPARTAAHGTRQDDHHGHARPARGEPRPARWCNLDKGRIPGNEMVRGRRPIASVV